MSDMSPEAWLEDLSGNSDPNIRSEIDDLMELAAAEPSPVQSRTTSRDPDTTAGIEQTDDSDTGSNSQPLGSEVNESHSQEQNTYIKREDSEMADYRSQSFPEIPDSQPTPPVSNDTVMEQDTGNSSTPSPHHERKVSHSPSIEEDLAYAQAALNLNSPPRTGDDDDNDDDDIMIIEPSSASAFARSRWSEDRPDAFAQDVESVFIKPEPSPEPSPEASPEAPPVCEVTPPLKTQRELQAEKNARMKATQKDILRNLGLRGIGLGQGLNLPQSTGWIDPAATSSSAEAPYPDEPRYDSPEPNSTYSNIRPDTQDVDDAMRDDDDDHGWMLEDADVDEEYEELKAQYTKLKNRKKKQKDRLSAQDELELFKIEKQIALKERLMHAANRRSADPAGEDEDSLFVSQETPDETIARRRHGVTSRKGKEKATDSPTNRDSDYDQAMVAMLERELEGEQEDFGVTKSGKPRKKRAKPAKNAKEWVRREEEAAREKARKKTQKQKGRAPAATSFATRDRPAVSKITKAKGKAKASSSRAKKSGKSAKKGKVIKNGASLLKLGVTSKKSAGRWGGEIDEASQMILDDLMYNDPLQDRLQNPIFNVAPEEEITGGLRTKASQFSLLFANIPNASTSAQGFQTAAGEPLTGKAEAQIIKSDKKKLRDASKAFGYAQVKAMDGKWLIKGMISTLYHHQLLGAQWMLQRELSSQTPHGGLLADSMGLGKTVQTLACMVGNPPGSSTLFPHFRRKFLIILTSSQGDKKRGVKSTLIVVPAGVMDQWIAEIHLHTDKTTFPKIMKYKTSSNVSIEILEDIDIVVTSYNEVMKQFPFPNKDSRPEIVQKGYKSWWKEAVINMGDLHKVFFWET